MSLTRFCFLACLLVFVSAKIAQAQTGIVQQSWYESRIDSTAITFQWASRTPATTEAWIGEDSASGTKLLVDNSLTTQHTWSATALTPASTYYVKLVSRGSGFADSVHFFSSTSSPSGSTGNIQVFFNRSIDTTSIPRLTRPTGYNASFPAILHDRIAAATRSIDLALYSFNGAVGAEVAGWLGDAVKRGITVRLIADSAAIANSSPFKSLTALGVHAISNGFGASKQLWSNIHHNKFIIFDGRESDARNATVMLGSWNLTDQQTTTDFQNIMYVQDLALAKAYEREFNEEWGSSTELPDASHSRFSTAKVDNTPRSFNIGGREAHLFFSPNGGIVSAIQHVLRGCVSQVEFSIYSLTYDTLANALLDASKRLLNVHGIIGTGGSSDKTSELLAANLDVMHFSDYLKYDTLFHHKYCIVDPGSDGATVMTGSYNWSYSAETKNNENLFILKDRVVSEMYLSEWLARYHENGGKQLVIIPYSAVGNSIGTDPHLSLMGNRIYGYECIATITIFDQMGREVFATEHELPYELPAHFPAGMYFVRATAEKLDSVLKFVVR